MPACHHTAVPITDLHRSKLLLGQVLLGPEMGSRTVHFDALRREVQLAARFNSERLVQARSSGLRHTCLSTLRDGDNRDLATPGS